MQKLARFSASLLFLLPAGLFLPPKAAAQTRTPRGTPPPTFPLPPDTRAPAQQTLSTEQVQQQIQAKLDTEPILKGLKLSAVADEDTVILRGNIDSEDQRDTALHIAGSYAGGRKIIDKLVMKQRT